MKTDNINNWQDIQIDNGNDIFYYQGKKQVNCKINEEWYTYEKK